MKQMYWQRSQDDYKNKRTISLDLKPITFKNNKILIASLPM